MEHLGEEELHYDSIGEKNDIPIEEERELWKNYYINKYIFIPKNCPQCNHPNISIVNFNSTLNPIKGGCNNKTCKYRFYLRSYSFFKYFPKIPAQIIVNIIKQMILENKNATLIRKYLKEKYNNTKINIRIIFKIMLYIRKCIAQYLNYIYLTKEISQINGNVPYAIDESLFTHKNNIPIWVVGIVSTTNKENLRLHTTKIRNLNYLRTFIHKYIEPGNRIISDGWQGYQFLNNNNSGYIHISYNHGGGHWGIGELSTSHIEGIWSYLKTTIKRIYYSIPNKGFYFFLKESEFRYLYKNQNNIAKLEIFNKILKFNFNNNFIFSTVENLNSLV